jgi:hypothetical protein
VARRAAVGVVVVKNSGVAEDFSRQGCIRRLSVVLAIGRWLVTSRVDALVEGFASECCEVVECGTFACGLVLRLTLPRKQFELDE